MLLPSHRARGVGSRSRTQGHGHGAAPRCCSQGMGPGGLVPGCSPPSPLYAVPRRVLCPQINPRVPARCSQPYRCRISAHGHPLQGLRRAAASPRPVITRDKGVSSRPWHQTFNFYRESLSPPTRGNPAPLSAGCEPPALLIARDCCWWIKSRERCFCHSIKL